MKKIFRVSIGFSIMICVLSFSISVFAVNNISAKEINETKPTTTEARCNNGSEYFLLIPAWYRGLLDADTCKMKQVKEVPSGKAQPAGTLSLATFIWTIVLNIADGIFRLAGVISTGFIIWAGFQYMISQGNSQGISSAKSTLTNAIVGLTITVLASTITSFVIGALK